MGAALTGRTLLPDPTKLFCFRVCGCPSEAEEFWKGNFACFIQTLPRVKGTGYELVILGLFIGDAERRARHRDDKNIAGDPDSHRLSSDQFQQFHLEPSTYDTSIRNTGAVNLSSILKSFRAQENTSSGSGRWLRSRRARSSRRKH